MEVVMAGGRPTAYDPEYCDAVIEYGKAGKSLTWIATELGVVKQTIHNWMAEHIEFLDAMTRAKELSQRWWEDEGQVGLTADKFNSSVWSRSMAARFPDDWREIKGTELTGKDGGPVAVKAEKAEWTIVDTSAEGGT
ncbi:hypothetical protein CDQ91_10340 [Sphingopyxis witflariensis]|uniref:Resolvase HTH domain-containing protein n=2 Tax=Sphingopyxis witflariensis TaxID=173675 RepID=A0A246JY72_9SPHN|nr:hypothetical protein CDQ91_10340 [Sphingopyxis witflariensis]